MQTERKNAVNLAAKNYAVIRTPYSNQAPYLIELTPEELASGQCNYDQGEPPVGGQPPRVFAPIPGRHEDALQLNVAVGPDQWDAPVNLNFRMDTQRDEFIFAHYGQPAAYTMVVPRQA